MTVNRAGRFLKMAALARRRILAAAAAMRDRFIG
jgi:hypothetical protein